MKISRGSFGANKSFDLIDFISYYKKSNIYFFLFFF